EECRFFHAGDGTDGTRDLHREGRPAEDRQLSDPMPPRKKPLPKHHLRTKWGVLAAREIDARSDLRRVGIGLIDLFERVDEVPKRIHGPNTSQCHAEIPLFGEADLVAAALTLVSPLKFNLSSRKIHRANVARDEPIPEIFRTARDVAEDEAAGGLRTSRFPQENHPQISQSRSDRDYGASNEL